MSLLTDQEQARLIDAETHALEGASLADVMTTLASLPLPENEDYAPMQEHIRLALAIHGVVPNSPECIKLSEGILIHLATERERLLRFFESAARAREEMGQPRITCEDCALCGAIQATDRIRKTEPMPPQDESRLNEEMSKKDHFATRVYTRTATSVDEKVRLSKIGTLFSLLNRVYPKTMQRVEVPAFIRELMDRIGLKGRDARVLDSDDIG